MAPNRLIDNPYGDERRNYSPRVDSFRPDDRERSHPPRRESKDSGDRRFSNDSRDGRSPLESRYGYPKDLRPQADTPFSPPAAPKKSNLSNKSPARAADNLTDELRFKRLPSTKSIATSIVGSPSTPTIPKAKDPRLQEAFRNAYNWSEKSNERLLLIIRKNKFAQEALQRRTEVGKIAAKASSYPPYHGLADKYAPIDQNLDHQLKLVEDDYLRELEQLVSRFHTVAKPASTNDQVQVSTNLETKVEQFSQLASKQAEQIQTLITEGAKTRETITSLETAIKSMESEHNLVKQKYNALKSEHESLKSSFRTWRDVTQGLQSKQLNIDNENKSLKRQLLDFQSSTEVKLGSSEAQLMQLAQKSSNAGEPKKEVEISLEERIAGIETKLAGFPDYDDIKEKLDDLDLATFNEMCEAWVSKDYNLKTQYEEYSQRRRQKPLPVDNDPSLSSQTVENMIDSKVAAAKESINNEIRSYCEQRDDMHGDLIDDALAQIQALKEDASSRSELVTRVRLLEERKNVSPVRVEQNPTPDLTARISRLEGKAVDLRVDRIDHDVGELSRRYESLVGEVGQLVRREWVELRVQELLSGVGMNTAVVGDMRDLQRKIPSMELAIKSLDAQFQNLSTKQLAEHIIRLTAPSLEQRFATLEIKVNQLENKANESDKAITYHAKRLLEINELLHTMIPSGKRPASPSHSEEPSKKRKIDLNGGHHTSPVQTLSSSDQKTSS
ncbi:hypothetical protein GGS21DRAFT_307870 [Xylaria nigripes]|nr:hypothetical protein GGS21DRAFT_307870 [Xylaria nigripes]